MRRAQGSADSALFALGYNSSMRIVPAVEAELRRVIRDARAKDPLISVANIKKELEERFQRGFSYQYVAKIADKVARESLVEADRTQIEQRMNFTRENYRLMRERLMKIVYWKPEYDGKPPWHKDVIEAAKAIAMLDLALLRAEIECGMYKKPIAAIAREFQYEPLSGEVRAIVIAAWARGGLLPRATIEQMVPIKSNIA
jgi:hypothetical protein